MNFAILLSGGTGSRMGADIPKQYIEVEGYPIIYYTLKNLLSCDSLDGLVIVSAPEWKEYILEQIQKLDVAFRSDFQILFAIPGDNRQGSILNGLNLIEGEYELSDNDYVIVHDAVRPLLGAELIDYYFDAVKGYDGLIPVLPMKDTVYFSNEGKSIDKLLDRSKIYAGQAPEIFNVRKYITANRRLSKEELLAINGSTEPAILYDISVRMVPGDERNFKITTPEDLKRFTEIIKNR